MLLFNQAFNCAMHFMEFRESFCLIMLYVLILYVNSKMGYDKPFHVNCSPDFSFWTIYHSNISNEDMVIYCMVFKCSNRQDFPFPQVIMKVFRFQLFPSLTCLINPRILHKKLHGNLCFKKC